MLKTFGAISVFLMAAGCDCGGTPMVPGPCDRSDPPPECEQACSSTEPCPSGFYCGEAETCTQDCDALRPFEGCPDGVCTADGRCMPTTRSDGGLDSSIICADVRVQATRVTPTVILIVDQSGSMNSDFGSSDRWNSLRDSLLAEPDGFIAALESQVRFGLALYSARAPDNSRDPVPGMCPEIEYIPPALDNFETINGVYGVASPIDETPTGESVDEILSRFSMAPDPTNDPTIFVLATDGEPDTCNQPNPQEGQPEAVAAVERAYTAGVRTFIISVGREISQDHLQDVANAGVGNGPGDPDAEFWVAGDDEGLREALRTIIGGELSCELTLNGMIQDLSRACDGRVVLNGRTLACDDPDGWRAVDATHIELVGEACDQLMNTPAATLEAIFPCDIILI